MNGDGAATEDTEGAPNSSQGPRLSPRAHRVGMESLRISCHCRHHRRIEATLAAAQRNLGGGPRAGRLAGFTWAVALYLARAGRLTPSEGILGVRTGRLLTIATVTLAAAGLLLGALSPG